MTRDRLLLLSSAMKSLLCDELFVTLLQNEGLADMPEHWPLASSLERLREVGWYGPVGVRKGSRPNDGGRALAHTELNTSRRSENVEEAPRTEQIRE